MPAWLRNYAGVVVILTLVLGTASFLSLALHIGRPFGGYTSSIYTSPMSSPGAVLVQEMPSWWPAYQMDAPFGNKTVLLTVNGQSHRLADIGGVFAEAAASGEKSVLIEADRLGDGQVDVVAVPVERFGFTHFLELKLPELITGLCLWLTAVAVLKARPDEPVNRAYAVAAALVGGQRWLILHSLVLGPQWRAFPFEAPLLVIAGFIGVSLLYFAAHFPTRLPHLPGWFARVCLIVGLALGLALIPSRLPPVHTAPDTVRLAVYRVTDVTYALVLLIYLAAMGLLLGRMIWLWLRGRESPRQRRMAGLVALGILVASPTLLVLADSVIPALGSQAVPFWQGLDLRYLLVAVPLSLALVIIRYQSMRSPSRWLILVVALAVSALVASVLSWLWGRAQGDWPASGRHPPFPYLFAGILLVSLFWSTQANWRGWFGRLLEWDTQSYSATRSFGRRVSGITHLNELSAAIAGALISELQLVRAAVWVLDDSSGALTLAAEAGATEPSLPTMLAPVADFTDPSPLRLDLSEDALDWLSPLRQQGAIDVVVPLTGDGHLIGLLGLGHRWDEEVFEERDLIIAELVGQQAGLFLLAARQVEELRKVPTLIVAAQESERRRLAAELHDTVQQFLGALPFALGFTPEQIRREPEAVATMLDRCLGETEAMAQTVRRIRFNLAPSQLDYSLTLSLDDLAASLRRRSEARLEVDIDDGLDAVTSIATREALFRVIQQALENTIAHAGARLVQVRLEYQEGRVRFSVTDDGGGSSEEQRRAAAQGGHFGLSSMRTRLEIVGGEFEFASAPGCGTTVSGWVPGL